MKAEVVGQLRVEGGGEDAFPADRDRMALVRGEDVDPGSLRAEIDRFPRHAALKHVLVRRGVPIREDVRAPLRGLTGDERDELDRLLDSVLQPA